MSCGHIKKKEKKMMPRRCINRRDISATRFDENSYSSSSSIIPAGRGGTAPFERPLRFVCAACLKTISWKRDWTTIELNSRGPFVFFWLLGLKQLQLYNSETKSLLVVPKSNVIKSTSTPALDYDIFVV